MASDSFFEPIRPCICGRRTPAKRTPTGPQSPPDSKPPGSGKGSHLFRHSRRYLDLFRRGSDGRIGNRLSGLDPGDGPCFPDDEPDNDKNTDTGCPDDTSTSTPSGSTFHETHPNDSRSCSQGSRHAWVALLIGLGLRGRRRSSLPRDQSFN